jgi:hypothetical protein
MEKVVINSVNHTISVEVISQSMHALGFDIVVCDTDDNNIEELKGDTEASATWRKDLKSLPAGMKEVYVTGAFTFQSPDGTDYPYKASFLLLVDNQPAGAAIILSGTTVSGSGTETGVFDLIIT